MKKVNCFIIELKYMTFWFYPCIFFWIMLVPVWATGQITSSARFLAMGESGAAFGGQVEALLGNPSGIAFMKRPALLMGHRYLFHQPDVSVQTVQFAIPVMQHHFGLSLIHFGLPDAYRDLDLGFVYARRFGPHLGVALGIRH